MGKIKFTGQRDMLPLMVPALGVAVLSPGQVIDCPDELVYNFTLQEIWQPADKASTTLHNRGAAEEQARLNPQPAEDDAVAAGDDSDTKKG